MFNFKNYGKIKYLTSDIIDENIFGHAFSTRTGGVTPAPLNDFSMSFLEYPEFKDFVADNKKKMCEILDADYEKLINPEQKHTDNIALVKEIPFKGSFKETDGVITNVPGVPVMLMFADCVPVMLFDEKRRVLGVIHAGWRGTSKMIVKKAVEIFKKEFNSSPNEIKAIIGPSISQCCYDVTEEVAHVLNMTIKSNYDNIFFKEKDSKKIRVDLKTLNFTQLKESGVENIDVATICTSCRNDVFYSYRKDNGKTGRHCAISVIKE